MVGTSSIYEVNTQRERKQPKSWMRPTLGLVLSWRGLWAPEGIWTEVPLAAGWGAQGLFPDCLVYQSCLFAGQGGKFHHLTEDPVAEEREGTTRTLLEILEKQT